LPDFDLVITIDRMTKKNKRPVDAAAGVAAGGGPGGAPGGWKGDAVAERPGGDAEQGADRVEGNEPVRADAESERFRHPGAGPEPSQGQRRPARAEGPEEDTTEVSEEHQARDEKERPPRGKL
jgi:hypothetical protein